MSKRERELCDTPNCDNDAMPNDWLCETCADDYVQLTGNKRSTHNCNDERICDMLGCKNAHLYEE